MTRYVLHVDTPLARGMRELFARVESRLELKRPLDAYLAGGMAVHLYTGKRVTSDVDAEFSSRVLLPGDVAVDVADGQQTIFIDANYNPMFALLHQDYQRDAVDAGMGLKYLHVRVLTPVDLAVSKIARFAPNDREDIKDLVRLGLTSAAAIEERGTQALQDYIGNTSMVAHNLRDAVASARAVQPRP